MDLRTPLELLKQAQGLADAGQHVGVLECLRVIDDLELEQTPALAMLRGMAHARLGESNEGERWTWAALRSARAQGDGRTALRARNVLAAIALESGRTHHAERCFEEGMVEAKRQGDHATLGRIANNLGVIADMRGDHGRAVGSYTMALAAYQQADETVGIAESLHNLAVAYREMSDFEKALRTEEQAVQAAEASGDRRLIALTKGGRAEIRFRAGDLVVAQREIELAIDAERANGDVVGEAEDLRVLACVRAAMDLVAEAEQILLDVIACGEKLGRPLLVAQAERDLAWVLDTQEREKEARARARSARQRFQQLGLDAEVRKLDVFLSEDRHFNPFASGELSLVAPRG